MTAPVQVRLDLSRPATQTVAVTISWTPVVHRQTFQLPVWTPGSYTVRDHVQHLHSLQLSCGDQNLQVRRLAPHQWICDLPDLSPLTLRYSLEARDLTVRTGLLDPDFASLCLAAVAMEIEGCRWSPHLLDVIAPDDWLVHLPLPRDRDGWTAADFDDLVDSPLHAGPFAAQQFSVSGRTHELVLIGAPPNAWPTQFLRDVERVCEATCRLMQTPPPAGDRYQLVLQLLEKGYGGLEHDHSAVLQFSWSSLATAKGYRQLLQLIGHEYLHQWNVRRLRPVEFLPYDYGQAVVSEGLWFAEGITSYFDLSLPMLAGCSDRLTLIKDLGEELSSVLMTPGRSIQSLADSAREAWVKLYKATPASRDTQVSYYRLGTAAAFCIDVRLRQCGHSLSELLRQLWATHGVAKRGFSRLEVLDALSRFNTALAAELEIWLDQPDSLPLSETVECLGMRLDPVPMDHPDAGLMLQDRDGSVLVQRVTHQGPGQSSGLVVGDELIAVNGFRLRRSSELPGLLGGHASVAVTFSRRGLMRETQLFPDKGVDHWELSWDPGATPEQRSLRDRWFEIL